MDHRHEIGGLVYDHLASFGFVVRNSLRILGVLCASAVPYTVQNSQQDRN